MPAPTGNRRDRAAWYARATEADLAYALLEERSPQIIERVIGNTLPSHQRRLRAVATLASQSRSHHRGHAISRGIDALRKNWNAAYTDTHLAAMHRLAADEDGLRLFRDLWPVVDQPGIVDQFLTHPDPDVQHLVISSGHVSEASLLHAIETAKNSPEQTGYKVRKSIFRTIAESKSPGYTIPVIDALITLNKTNITRDVLQNPYTPPLKALDILTSGQFPQVDILQYGTFPFLTRQHTPEHQAARQGFANFLADYPSDGLTREGQHGILNALHQLATRNTGNDPTKNLPEGTAYLIDRWLPHAAVTSEVNSILGIYDRLLTHTPDPTLRSPSALATIIVEQWTEQGNTLAFARNIADFVQYGLLAWETASQALIATPTAHSDKSESVRSAIIRQICYPATKVKPFINPKNEHHQYHILARIEAFKDDDVADAARLHEDIDVLLPLLPRTKDIRERLSTWMARLAVKQPITLRYLATHPDTAIRRITATNLHGYPQTMKKRTPSYGAVVRDSDATIELVDTTHLDILRTMMTDDDDAVRRAVAASELLTIDDLNIMRQDRIANVRSAAKKRILETLTL